METTSVRRVVSTTKSFVGLSWISVQEFFQKFDKQVLSLLRIGPVTAVL